jgi:signal transduction histidine kinase
MSLLRILQEALTNVRRHSGSARVRVELVGEGGRLRAEIRDWGVGFDLASVGPGHFGLQEIRERARLLGGRATIDSAPGRGTRVTVILPIW